jgi:adenylate cyclase
MKFRIGIHLGDVLLQGNDRHDVHGNAVNIAARLERLAEPGGICISGLVYEQVKNKLACRYTDLGNKSCKNIKNPIPVYRMLWDPSLPSLPEKRGKEESHTPVIVVRSFEVLKIDPRHAWIKENEVVPRRLNSELSQVPGLMVYSAEHFDWLLHRGHLSAMELARTLGISKVIRGSLLAEANMLRIEAHLEDVETIDHEPSEEVYGKPDDFLTLIQELATKITRRLS